MSFQGHKFVSKKVSVNKFTLCVGVVTYWTSVQHLGPGVDRWFEETFESPSDPVEVTAAAAAAEVEAAAARVGRE